MTGKTTSHYHILEKIGAGGRGEVYLAHDTTLDRRVALKFLPDILRGDAVASERISKSTRNRGGGLA
jgi:serine/threonine protein kinase